MHVRGIAPCALASELRIQEGTQTPVLAERHFERFRDAWRGVEDELFEGARPDSPARITHSANS
jgi:hypothetical protein